MKNNTYSLTNPQNSIWVTEQFHSGTNINNISGTLLINEKVDFNNFTKAINLFIKNNDSFRLKLFNENNEIKQFVSDYEPFDIEIIDVHNEDELKQLEEKLTNTVFNTLNSLLFEFKLFKYDNGYGGFVLNAHHLISDAWSHSLLINEIMDNYYKLLNNEDIPAKELSYVDYINSEKEYLKTDKFKKDELYWNEFFATVPEVATIPSFKTNSNSLSSLAIRKQFVLQKDFVKQVNSFCEKNKVSVYNFFMGVLSIYLGRVSNLDDFVIGTPILNRSNFKEKHTTGMFISVMPFRITMNSEESFTEFLKTISKNAISIFRHQKYPYQLMLENLRKKDSSIPNLYNVMLSYQNMRSNASSSEIDYSSTWHFTNNIADKLDIHLFDINDEGLLNIAYDYAVSDYTEQDVIDIHNRLLTICKQVLDNEEIILKNIEIVTPEEKNKILYEFNNTKMDYPKDKTIVQLFEEQVEKTPDNIAVVFENQTLTYKELNEKANQLAHYLREQGVKNNDVVGIMLNRSLELIVAIISVVKSGAAYLLVDTTLPNDRITYMLDNANISLIISNSELRKFSKNTICLDKFYFSNYSINNIKSNITIDDNLCIIYTSGSTGKPKGVLLKKIGINNLIFNFQNILKTNICKNFLSISTISFDMFMVEIYLPILSGSTIILANDSEKNTPINISKLIEKYNVDFIVTTPSKIELLLITEQTKSSLKNLKVIQLGGEPFTHSLFKKLRSVTNATLNNGYGPTEATACCSNKEIVSASNINIGKPFYNTQIYILDNSLQLCPIGMIGEICISGIGIAKCYVNNTTLTNKSFVTNPYNEGTLYKTGDLARYNYSGEIEFIGRRDLQIKLRGQRIELNEINNAIKELSYVFNSITLLQNINGHQYICSYIISSINNISYIKKELSRVLPIYMIPSYIVLVKDIPLNFNGKVDTKLLPPITMESTVNYIAPSTKTEINVSTLLKKILNIEQIGINDNFFDIGLDSLGSIRLITELYNTININITVKDIFDNNTIYALSKYIDSLALGETIDAIPKVEKQDYYPVSSAQKRIYYASQIAGQNSMLYNISGGVILNKIPNINKLQKSFNTLVNRHESLRTYFEIVDNTLVQKIADNLNFNIEVEENCNKKIDDIFTNFAKPFDLSKAPLIRVKLATFKDGTAVLLLDIHHIISDGTSQKILIEELCKLYNEENLPALSISYKDYAVWENNKLNSKKFDNSKNYWVNQFSDEIPVLNIPTVYPRPSTQSFDGAKLYSKLDSNLTSNIYTLCKKLNITPYMFLLSAYYILLYKYTSQEDIVVGSPIIGRDNAELTNIIGMFVNTLALRNKINSNDSFEEFVNNIKSTTLKAFENQTYPFDELVNNLNINRDSSRNILFDTMFIYQNGGNGTISFDNSNATYYIPDINISKFDLSLEIIPENDILNLNFEYCTKLFDKEFINKLSTHYINIIKNILDNSKINISAIDMLSVEEKDNILYKFNNTEMDYPKDKTVVDLFEEQVEKNPNKIAVIFEDTKLTYKELNEKANQLANYLKTKKVKSNDIVGIMLDRSLELIITMFGVLKSGAGYMLIDYNLPDDRITYMLENAECNLLITNSQLKIIDYKNILYIDTFNFDNYSNENLNNIKSINDSFCIIYTSGSTGTPKGIALKHQGVVNLVYSYKKILHTDICKNFLSISTVSFDMFIVETFVPTLSGKTMILSNTEEQKIPIPMSNLIIKNKADFILTTPSRIELLLQIENTSSCLQNFKVIQLGGEIFTNKTYNMLKKYTNATIYNGYGPSEITACCCNKEVNNSKEITIGTPFGNTQIYILNKDNNLCPTNVIGEICVAGNGVSKGYINNLANTEKAFKQNPFGKGFIYKTGDLGYYNTNNEIVFVGRNDNQIKIRGLRVELSEIENKLLSIPEIQNCTVLYYNIPNNSFLTAFFSAKDKLDTTYIRTELGKDLPLYMIPKYFIQLEALPVTPNGKINKKALESYKMEHIQDDNYVAPTNKLQKIFCETWENLLNTRIGIDDDIFEKGADSLLAIQFKSTLCEKKIDINYADIFKYKTVRDLSNIKQDVLEEPIIDYSYLNTLLNANSKENEIVFSNKNNVLLLGANGFVGMHIINDFIKNDNGNIYCVMRKKDNLSALDRFINTLHFYFGNTLDKYINKRIFIVEATISKPNFGLSYQEFNSLTSNISCIINSAALVKHYGNYEDFKQTNIDIISKLIEFCIKYNKRLLHISTMSIAENINIDNSMASSDYKEQIVFSEKTIYIGQKLNNIYLKSKFEAEKLIIENLSKGLNAQILRLGNMTSRYTDGQFQINPTSNTFVSHIKAFGLLGYIPDYILDVPIEFTPVDLCSTVINKILQNDNKNSIIYHIYNPNGILIKKLIQIFKECNMSLKPIKHEEFVDTLYTTLANSTDKECITRLLSDLDENNKFDFVSNVILNSKKTLDFLENIGFIWPKIDEVYIKKYMNYLKKIKLI